MDVGRHPEREEIREAVKALPWFNIGTPLDSRDALALLRDANDKLPHLGEELREQTGRLIKEIEEELEMSPDDEVIVDERILRGLVSRALRVGAAQALFDAGQTAQEVHDLRELMLVEPQPPENTP